MTGGCFVRLQLHKQLAIRSWGHVKISKTTCWVDRQNTVIEQYCAKTQNVLAEMPAEWQARDMSDKLALCIFYMGLKHDSVKLIGLRPCTTISRRRYNRKPAACFGA